MTLGKGNDYSVGWIRETNSWFKQLQNLMKLEQLNDSFPLGHINLSWFIAETIIVLRTIAGHLFFFAVIL